MQGSQREKLDSKGWMVKKNICENRSVTTAKPLNNVVRDNIIVDTLPLRCRHN